MKQSLLILACLSGLFWSCHQEKEAEEQLLWEYYRGFTYPPELFDSLSSLAREEPTRRFFEGLRCFEKYDQLDSVSCYDSARIIFDALMADYPDSYLGYLGKGILITERGRKERSRENPYQHWMDSAEWFYKTASLKEPGHGAIYYYRGRNQYNRNLDTINLLAIAYLDTAVQLREKFFKATERSAEFLSHYLDLSEKLGGDSRARFQSAFPNVEERIKYYFNKSLTIDSSWYQTYQGIAKAIHVYSARERIDYLNKGISIARSKRSRDSIDLMLSLLKIYHRDLQDYERARTSFTPLRGEDKEAQKIISWAAFYLNEEASETQAGLSTLKAMDAAEGMYQLYHYHRLSGSYDSAAYYLRQVMKEDPSRYVKYQLEQVKLTLQRGQKAEAIQLLKQLLQEGEKQWGDDKFSYDEYNKAFYLLRYFEGYQ
jgi:hypothetical protein